MGKKELRKFHITLDFFPSSLSESTEQWTKGIRQVILLPQHQLSLGFWILPPAIPAWLKPSAKWEE